MTKGGANVGLFNLFLNEKAMYIPCGTPDKYGNSTQGTPTTVNVNRQLVSTEEIHQLELSRISNVAYMVDFIPNVGDTLDNKRINRVQPHYLLGILSHCMCYVEGGAND